MTLRLCDGERLGVPCRALFAVGLARCPHCKSSDHHEFGTEPGDEEHPMSPKITRTGGASVAAGSDAGGAEAEVPQAETHDAPPAEPGLDQPTEDTQADDSGPERPAVNARKDEHLAYAEEAYGVDPEWADDAFTKRQLLTTLDRLEAGELIVAGDGQVLEPGSDEPVSGDSGSEPTDGPESPDSELEGIELAEGETGELTNDGSGEALPDAD